MLERNIRYGAESIRLFEIGRASFVLNAPEESARNALAYYGKASETNWRNEKERLLDLFDIRGMIYRLTHGKAIFREKEISGFVLGLEILIADKSVGSSHRFRLQKRKYLVRVARL